MKKELKFLNDEQKLFLSKNKSASDAQLAKKLSTEVVMIESAKRNFVDSTRLALCINRKHNPEDTQELINISSTYIVDNKVDRETVIKDLFSIHSNISNEARESALKIIYAATGGREDFLEE